MQLDLEAHPPQAPIVYVWMGANPVKPQAAQSGLFIPAAPEPVKLELTLARIKAIVGENRAGIAERLNTHRPDAFRMMECSLHVGQAGNAPGSDRSHDRKGVVVSMSKTSNSRKAGQGAGRGPGGPPWGPPHYF